MIESDIYIFLRLYLFEREKDREWRVGQQRETEGEADFPLRESPTGGLGS